MSCNSKLPDYVQKYFEEFGSFEENNAKELTKRDQEYMRMEAEMQKGTDQEQMFYDLLK